MRIIVTGAKGQLGIDLSAELQSRGHETIGADIDNMDITDCNAVDAFIAEAKADAALAASLFHYKELTVGEVKDYLHENGIPVRRNIKL